MAVHRIFHPRPYVIYIAAIALRFGLFYRKLENSAATQTR